MTAKAAQNLRTFPADGGGSISTAARLRMLRGCCLEDPATSDTLDRLARIATRVVHAEKALITLCDDRRHVIRGRSGCLPEPEGLTALLESCFGTHPGLRREALNITDAPNDQAVSRFLDSEHGVRGLLALPLVNADDQGLGAFCVLDTRPRPWSAAQIEGVRDLAEAAAAAVDERERLVEAERIAAVLASERRALDRLVQGAPLGEALDVLLEEMEAQVPGMLCSVLLLDGETLRHGAAPSLPAEYKSAIDGMRVGPAALACGTAVYRREPVIVPDIATDASWLDLREPALAHGLRACCATPLYDSSGAVVGTLATYYREPRTPPRRDAELAIAAARVAELLIERAAAERERADLLDRERTALASAAATADRMRALVQGLDAVVWEADAQTFRFTFVSDQAERVLGYPVEQWLREFDFWVDLIHPEDRDWAVNYCLRHTNEGLDHEFEYRAVAADGRIVWLRDLVRVAVDAEGRPLQLRGVMVDITEQKRAEEALRASEAAQREEARLVETLHAIGRSLATELDLRELVQTATDAATSLTSAAYGAFFYNVLNDDGESYLLYTLSGAPVEAFSGFGLPRNTPIFAPTFRGEGIVRHDDVLEAAEYGRAGPHHGMPEGHPPVRSYLAVPVVTHSGQVLGGFFFGHPEPGRFTDKHERIAVGIAGWTAVAMDNARLLEAEQRARANAERANRVKSDFLAVMSHELRTPLNAMLGYSDLLLMGVPEPLPDPARAHVQRVQASARHLLELIEEILTFSRLDAGHEKVRIERIPVTEFVSETAEMIRPLALQKALEFHCTGDPAGLRIETDPGKLRQILLNLLSNAIKFTETGVVRLEVEQDGEGVRFRVTDTGPGIEKDQMERIFEPFWQADSRPTRQRGGTGLGLAVSRQLASLLNGGITVDSEPGRGSAFTVWLPLRHSAAAGEPVA